MRRSTKHVQVGGKSLGCPAAISGSVVELLVPEHARVIAAGCRSHEKKAWDALGLKDCKHVGQSVEKSVVAGPQNGAWGQRLTLFCGCAKIFGVYDTIASFQELKFLRKISGCTRFPSRNLSLTEWSAGRTPW